MPRFLAAVTTLMLVTTGCGETEPIRADPGEFFLSVGEPLELEIEGTASYTRPDATTHIVTLNAVDGARSYGALITLDGDIDESATFDFGEDGDGVLIISVLDGGTPVDTWVAEAGDVQIVRASDTTLEGVMDFEFLADVEGTPVLVSATGAFFALEESPTTE